ncbi:MAG: tetratricopeptide repeat protein [Gammaproteobacteria bacterium]|nr:tetratricopeptide repeat protein [Gammaproteobacteria bacterium]
MLASCSSFDFRYGDNEVERLTGKILGPPLEIEGDAPPTLALSDAAKRRLDERIQSGWNGAYKLRQLRMFLFDPDELGIQYDAAATRTAMGVWETGSGNCLSMTNLFIAAARYVGLNASFTTVDVAPTWDHAGATMVRYEHILATGRLGGGTEYVMDFLPEFVLDDNPSETISDRDALKLFYSNLGAEALLHGQTEAAIAYLQRALQIDPEFSNGWNNMGAALRRDDRFELAEFAYQRALDLDPGNLSAMSNLAQCYESQGRDRDAEHLMARVREYRARNPYFHFYLARLSFEQGEYETSIEFLEYSIRLKRDEPKFYEAIAKTYEQMGDEEQVAEYLALAEKFREPGAGHVPERQRQHRFFIRRIDVR